MPEITIPPAHCWSIKKIKVRGMWYAPLYPWACLDVQVGAIDLMAFQTANGFPYPMYGPFAVSNLGPTVATSAIPVPPLNTPAWLTHFNTDIWYTYDASVAFYDWVTSIHGVAPVVGEFITLEDSNPIVPSDSIDQSIYPGQNELIEAWCLEYHGVRDSYGPNGYDSAYALLDSGHINNVTHVPSTSECQNEPVTYPAEKCGEIGSINPETGGIVFATHQGPDSCLWYEAAPTDVEFAPDPSGNLQIIGSGGTPDTAIGTLNCGIPYEEETILLNSTSAAQTRYGTSFPAQPTPWTNLLMHGPLFQCTPTGYGCYPLYVTGGLSGTPQNDITFQAIGIGPNSDNPQINASNYQNDISIGTKAYFFDENGDPCYMYGASSAFSRDTHYPNAYNVVSGVTIIPANTSGAIYHPLQNGNISAYTSVSNDHDVLIITMNSDPSFGVNTYGLLPWCDVNPASGHSINTGMNSSPTGKTPIWSTKFVNTVQPPAGNWTATGLEWGVHDRTVNQGGTFSHYAGSSSNNPVGLKNSQIIDGHLQTAVPLTHPIIDSRHIAAEEALRYIAPNQLINPERAEWFLPSMDEFTTMISAVGPDANATWSNPVNQTQPHVDFQNSFNNSAGQTSISENVYWTSSQDDANSVQNNTGSSTYIGTSPDKVAIAVKLAANGSNVAFPEPLFTSRCHPLSVRPIRVYRCTPCPEDEPEYNFRDSHNIWVDGDGAQGTAGGGQQSLTPFVNIYSPGGAASSRSQGGGFLEVGTIGFNRFNIGLGTTDVMGNAPKDAQFLSSPDYDFFTNYDGNPSTNGALNGRNPNGVFISIWDNQKQFIGKWHYEKVWRTNIQENKLNWSGYLTACDPSNSSHIPNVNCNPSPSYTTNPDDFPDMVSLAMRGVTLIEGSPFLTMTTPSGERPFRYGGNREESARHYWGNPGVPFSDWHHPYMENVFNGWTSSYAYIKVECQETSNLGSNAFNKVLNGPNTDIDGMHVVCMRNLFLDEYQGFSPPHPDLAPYVGSILGCGDCSDHSFNDALSAGGGYGWQSQNPSLKANSAFGDLYGINYFDGRRQEPSYLQHGQGGPILAQHPKHWAFIWHGAQQPLSGSLNLYLNLHDGYNSCFGYRCHYNLGDTGPAGGVIVGIPGMFGNEIVPGGASSNDSDWYYEMSPEDLHDEIWGVNTEFGVYQSYVPYSNLPMSADGNLSYGINSTGGNLNQSFSYDNPYSVIGNGIAETTQYQNGLLTLNPPGGPFAVPNSQSAFRLCDEYETFDIYGMKYCDWYLPNIQESWYIMNNAPAGTFTLNTDTHNTKGDLYWTSNQYDGVLTHPDAAGWDQLVRSTVYEQYNGWFIQGSPNPNSTKVDSAYAYNIAEKVVKGPQFPETDFYMYSPYMHSGYASSMSFPKLDSIVLVFDGNDLISSGQMFGNGSTLPPPFDVLGPCNQVGYLNPITPIMQTGAPGGTNTFNNINSYISSVNNVTSGMTHFVQWTQIGAPSNPHGGFTSSNYPNFPGLGNSFALAGTIGNSSVATLNWHHLSQGTKATYVVGKESALKVRAIRRFKCESECRSGGSGGPIGS